jgi:hypothetical protein
MIQRNPLLAFRTVKFQDVYGAHKAIGGGFKDKGCAETARLRINNTSDKATPTPHTAFFSTAASD